MGGYKGKAKAKKGGGKKGGFDRGAPTRTAEPHNFVADAGPGCVISHVAGPGCVISHVADPPWALGSERIDIRDYPKGTQFPDLAVDPDSGTLAVVNAHAEHRVVRSFHPVASSTAEASCRLLTIQLPPPRPSPSTLTYRPHSFPTTRSAT